MIEHKGFAIRTYHIRGCKPSKQYLADVYYRGELLFRDIIGSKTEKAAIRKAKKTIEKNVPHKHLIEKAIGVRNPTV